MISDNVGPKNIQNILQMIILNIQIFTVWINYQNKITNASRGFRINSCSIAPCKIQIDDISISQSMYETLVGSYKAGNYM